MGNSLGCSNSTKKKKEMGKVRLRSKNNLGLLYHEEFYTTDNFRSCVTPLNNTEFIQLCIKENQTW